MFRSNLRRPRKDCCNDPWMEEDRCRDRNLCGENRCRDPYPDACCKCRRSPCVCITVSNCSRCGRCREECRCGRPRFGTFGVGTLGSIGVYSRGGTCGCNDRCRPNFDPCNPCPERCNPCPPPCVPRICPPVCNPCDLCYQCNRPRDSCICNINVNVNICYQCNRPWDRCICNVNVNVNICIQCNRPNDQCSCNQWCNQCNRSWDRCRCRRRCNPGPLVPPCDPCCKPDPCVWPYQTLVPPYFPPTPCPQIVIPPVNIARCPPRPCPPGPRCPPICPVTRVTLIPGAGTTPTIQPGTPAAFTYTLTLTPSPSPSPVVVPTPGPPIITTINRNGTLPISTNLNLVKTGTNESSTVYLKSLITDSTNPAATPTPGPLVFYEGTYLYTRHLQSDRSFENNLTRENVSLVFVPSGGVQGYSFVIVNPSSTVPDTSSYLLLNEDYLTSRTPTTTTDTYVTLNMKFDAIWASKDTFNVQYIDTQNSYFTLNWTGPLQLTSQSYSELETPNGIITPIERMVTKFSLQDSNGMEILEVSTYNYP
jgi:hypothetical protein